MKFLTANRLTDGVVVFMNADHEWIRDIKRAARFDGDALTAATDKMNSDFANNVIVDVAVIDVDSQNEASPARLRERIRAFGPTIDYAMTGRKKAVQVAA